MTEQEQLQLAAKLEVERAELEPLFDKVCNQSDWKAPIDAFCRREDQQKVARAIEFYTATTATFTEPIPPCNDWVRVQAIGYRRGPAA